MYNLHEFGQKSVTSKVRLIYKSRRKKYYQSISWASLWVDSEDQNHNLFKIKSFL